MQKALIIDDSASLIGLFKRAFSGDPEIVVVECHSLEEALLAIDKEKPDILFIDNDLTGGGSEGLRIADIVKNSRIYSITLNDDPEIILEYEKRGIPIIGKVDFEKIKSIVMGKSDRK